MLNLVTCTCRRKRHNACMAPLALPAASGDSEGRRGWDRVWTWIIQVTMQYACTANDKQFLVSRYATSTVQYILQHIYNTVQYNWVSPNKQVDGCIPAPTGSLAEMGALLGAHASNAPSSGTGYTPTHNNLPMNNASSVRLQVV